MVAPTRSRRSFLLTTGNMLGMAWAGAHWSEIAAAAQHAASASPHPLTVLTAAEAAELEAIATQIIPSGGTPGAHEAHVVSFIDRALATFFAPLAQGFRASLTEFSQAFHARHAELKSFASASAEAQAAHLKSIEHTPFFQTVRFLTVLGFLVSPKYGGNAAGLGWKAIGFKDEHIFSPPFGYYDREYTGFVPYTPDQVS